MSGGGDEMGREETSRDGQRREGVGDKNEMGIGKPKRFEMVYIYYQNDAPLGSQVSFFFNIYIYIYRLAVSGYL